MRLIGKLTVAASMAALACAMGAPGEADAQAWIGQIAGQMAAQAAAAAREQACREGAPASPKDVQKATDKANQLMEAYFALSSSSKPTEFGRIFAKDATWKAPDGAVPIAELGKRLDEPKPTLTSLNFIVAGDDFSARGIWSATGEDGKPVIYAVDFQATQNPIYGRPWRIWHMAIFAADNPPAAPGAYCHFDPDQAW